MVFLVEYFSYHIKFMNSFSGSLKQLVNITTKNKGRGGEGREGKGREGKGREGKGRAPTPIILPHFFTSTIPHFHN